MYAFLSFNLSLPLYFPSLCFPSHSMCLCFSLPLSLYMHLRFPLSTCLPHLIVSKILDTYMYDYKHRNAPILAIFPSHRHPLSLPIVPCAWIASLFPSLSKSMSPILFPLWFFGALSFWCFAFLMLSLLSLSYSPLVSSLSISLSFSITISVSVSLSVSLSLPTNLSSFCLCVSVYVCISLYVYKSVSQCSSLWLSFSLGRCDLSLANVYSFPLRRCDSISTQCQYSVCASWRSPSLCQSLSVDTSPKFQVLFWVFHPLSPSATYIYICIYIYNSLSPYRLLHVCLYLSWSCTSWNTSQNNPPR